MDSNQIFRSCCTSNDLQVVKENAIRCKDINSRDRLTGRTALHNAAFFGCFDVVKYLVLELKMDPNVKDWQGDLPIHDAIRFGYDNIVRFLGKRGRTNTTLKNLLGENPIDTAISYSNHGLIKHLPVSRERL